MMGWRSRCYSTFVMGPEMWIVTTKMHRWRCHMDKVLRRNRFSERGIRLVGRSCGRGEDDWTKFTGGVAG